MTHGGATKNHWRQDGTVHHVTAGSIGIVAETNTNPGQQLYYTRLPDGTLLNERAHGGGTYNYLTDAQHTVAATTDNTGHAANSYRYDPYGNITILTGNAPNPWRYAGGYQDDQTGLYKYGARYYNPNLGQWTERDPSGQDPNPYTYAGGNPTTKIDRSGLAFCIFGHNDSGGCNGGSLVPDADMLSKTVSNIVSFARGCVQSAPAGEYLGLEAAPYVSMILGPEAGAAWPAVGATAACYAGGAYYLQFGGWGSGFDKVYLVTDRLRLWAFVTRSISVMCLPLLGVLESTQLAKENWMGAHTILASVSICTLLLVLVRRRRRGNAG